jgi:hypothetical protein
MTRRARMRSLAMAMSTPIGFVVYVVSASAVMDDNTRYCKGSDAILIATWIGREWQEIVSCMKLHTQITPRQRILIHRVVYSGLDSWDYALLRYWNCGIVTVVTL